MAGKLNYLSPEYVTYRLLQLSGPRADHLRKVARLVQPHPSAILFAEQFAGIDRVESRESVRPGASFQDYFVTWLVEVTKPQPTFGGRPDDIKTQTHNVKVSSYAFTTFYGSNDRSQRGITSATALQKYDESGYRISMGSSSRYGDSTNDLASYLPWFGFVAGKEVGGKGTLLSMIFGDRIDAFRYASRVMMGLSENPQLELDDFIKSGF